MTRPADLRLLPAAAASWAVVLVALLVGWVPAAALAAAAGVVALVALQRGFRLAAGLAAAGACAAAVGLVAVLQVRAVRESPLRPASAAGTAATLRVSLDSDPEPVSRPGYGARSSGAEEVVLHASVHRAVVAGRAWSTGGRVVLIAPASGWSALLPGQQLTAAGLLAPPTRADLTVAVLRVRGPPVALSAAPWWQRAAGGVRDGLRRAAKVLPEEPAGLLPGLVDGDTSGVGPGVQADFRTAGLTHLVAVSGTNVVIVCGAVLGLARLLRAGPRVSGLVAAVALVGFVVLARPSPSVLRAAVMGAVGLAALVLGRGRSAVPALCAAVIGLLLADPALAADPGFALSVLATGALVLLAPGWTATLRGRGVPAGVAEALAVPVAACLVTAPVIAALSGQVSTVTVAANVLTAPMVAPATVLGVLAALGAVLHPGVAEFLAQLAGPEVGWLVAVAHRAAAVPAAAVRWPGGAGGGLLLGAAAVLLVVVLRSRRVRVLAAAALVGVLLVLVPTRLDPPGWPVRGWAVVACDVGQGDAVVLATGQPGRAVLVDTGPEPSLVDACLSRLGVTSLALVVLSHLHADHVGGLAGALDGRPTAAVALGPSHVPVWALDAVARTAARDQVPLVALTAGQRVTWPGLALDVLGPRHVRPDVDPNNGTEVNDTSVVLRAETAVGRVLLAGDIELSAQAQLLDAKVDLAADVLKVPHHGSRYSAPAFLAAVHPRVALVSVGAGNPYGHPSGSVLDALHAAGALVTRTDTDGDLAVSRAGDGPAVAARGDPRPAPRRG